MNKNQWLSACMILSLAWILASCSPAPAPTVEPTQVSQPQPTQAELPTKPVIATEAPTAVVAGTNPYPAPAVEIEYLTTIDPYPAPPSGEKIEWSDVAALLAAGQVADVFQSHTLLVVINMRDGTSKISTEPAKDEIFKLLDQCGESCSQVKRVSEFFY